MPNNESLVIIIFGLIAILLIVGIYGVIGYKIYLRNNAKQIKDIADDYHKSQNENIKVMIELITHVEDLKRKKEI